MKKYRFWQGPILALFSSPFYASVAKHWKGIGMGYLLFVLAIAWIPGALKINKWIKHFENKELASIVEQLPPLEIEDGKMKTSATMPYSIKFEDGKEYVIIDSSKTEDDFDDLNVPILITENEIIFQKSKAEKRIYSFDQIPDLTVDAKVIDDTAKDVLSIGRFLLYPLAVINSFGARLVQAIVWGLVGLIIAAVLSTNISFGTSMRLAIVAMTPVILFRTLVFYFGLKVPYYWIITLAMMITYLFTAVKAANGESAEPDYSDIEADPY